MFDVVESVRQAVMNHNWRAALFSVLPLPDVCGWIDGTPGGSKKRSIAWWDQWMLDRYRVGGMVFLSGTNAYALRCAFLHNGSDDLSEHHARDLLDRFRFVTPPGHGNSVHCNLHDTSDGRYLQLQVDRFCLDVAAGVTDWCHATLQANDPDVIDRWNRSLTLHDPHDEPFFRAGR